MIIQSYNAELAIANLMFKRIFQNIVIERSDKDGKVMKIPVMCVNGKRSRIIKNFENDSKKGMYKLPLIAINRTGYARNSERLNNLHNEVKYEFTGKYRSENLLTPVPIDISYDVVVMSKYPSDIDQIASNFMVYFNSDCYVSCIHPKWEGIKLNNQVIITDNVNEEHPDEFDGSQDDFITSTFQFTFKTYLFGGKQQGKKSHKKTLSTYLSDIVSSQIIALKPDEIDKFQEEHPNSSVSAELTSMVTSALTVEIESDQLSDQIYDGIVPIIQKIDFGLYPVPTSADFDEWIKKVDTEFEDTYHDISGYMSSQTVLSNYEEYEDENGQTQRRLSSLTYLSDVYSSVDSYGTIYPYVDRLIWIINESSDHLPPNNVKIVRPNEISA